MSNKEIRGLIKENLKEDGYIKTHIFTEEYEQLKEIVGEFKTIAELRVAMLSKLGVTPHIRVKLSDEQKTANKVKKIANKQGISETEVQKALEILGLV